MEILEEHPDFIAADFHLERIEAARAGAVRVGNFAIDGKAAVVARAIVIFFVGPEIDKTTGVRTNDIEGLDRFLAGAPQVNRADGPLLCD